MPISEEIIKRAIYLKEEIEKRDLLVDIYLQEYDMEKHDSIRAKTERNNLREQISCLSTINRKLGEDIYSFELARCEEEFIETQRKRARLLDEIIIERIDKEKIVNERVEKLERDMETTHLKAMTLHREICGLKEEYKSTLLSLKENDVPEKLRDDYEDFRAEEEEEESDDNSIESEEIME